LRGQIFSNRTISHTHTIVPLRYMWQSQVEIEHYSTSVKNELMILIKALGLPPRHMQVPALFVDSTSSSPAKVL